MPTPPSAAVFYTEPARGRDSSFVKLVCQHKPEKVSLNALLCLLRWWRVTRTQADGKGKWQTGGRGKWDLTAPTWCILGMRSSGGQQGPDGILMGGLSVTQAPATMGRVERNICCQKKRKNSCGKKITGYPEERREVNAVCWLHRDKLLLEKPLDGFEIQISICTKYENKT